MADFIAHIDELYDQKKQDEVFEELKKVADSRDIEVLWRLCRAYYEQSELAKDNKELKKENLDKALDIVSKMKGLGVEHWAHHKWNAIVLSGMSTLIPLSEFQNKMKNAHLIKEEALKSLELKPKDPTVLHLLGRWCFNVPKKGFFGTFAGFAGAPTSTFDEALNFFLQANEIEPTVRNSLFIGDTYVQLGQKDNAKAWYKKAADLPFFGPVQEGFHDEALKKFAEL
eukprot:TRINITY_DN1978_c0_g2_i1.p1 TRINITY_DN1978_c0_g2~~TRINITY_DN1978_c0_g2_i1.p1  ORF type:complete len:257 (-),score=72.63 TRINITY_DN1978_c0_g2_i1:129-809(-)